MKKKFNKWFYNTKENSLMYKGEAPLYNRNLWLADSVPGAPFLQSMAKAIVTALNNNEVELESTTKEYPRGVRLKRK